MRERKGENRVNCRRNKKTRGPNWLTRRNVHFELTAFRFEFRESWGVVSFVPNTLAFLVFYEFTMYSTVNQVADPYNFIWNFIFIDSDAKIDYNFIKVKSPRQRQNFIDGKNICNTNFFFQSPIENFLFLLQNLHGPTA